MNLRTSANFILSIDSTKSCKKFGASRTTMRACGAIISNGKITNNSYLRKEVTYYHVVISHAKIQCFNKTLLKINTHWADAHPISSVVGHIIFVKFPIPLTPFLKRVSYSSKLDSFLTNSLYHFRTAYP